MNKKRNNKKMKDWCWYGNVVPVHLSTLQVTAIVKYVVLKLHLHPQPKKSMKKSKQQM